MQCMNAKNRSVIFLSCLLLVGCASFIVVEEPSSDVLLVDDFGKMANKWDIVESADGSAIGYYDGGLLFLVDSAFSEYISTPKGIFSNVRLETVAEKMSGAQDNYFGLVCRYQDADNYYAFLISSDGYYGIVKLLNGEYFLLNADAMQYSEHIRQAEEPNHIRAGCIGQDLILYTNDQFLAAAQDDAFESGEVGLITGSSSQSRVVIWFDSFVVLKP